MRIPELKARRRGAGRRGFTLVELLTVIAIIAILAALLMPVLATARENARQGSCMTNMQHLIQGLKMYKDDWRVYPDALYGIQYANVPFQTRLYPEYVKDRNAFNCPNSWIKTAASDPGPLVGALNPSTGMRTDQLPRPYQLPAWSSYDVQFRPNQQSGTPELHYTLKWTGGASGISDNPRQLIYRDPPDNTVVTWCLYHSQMDAQGNPRPDGMVLVGFLNGRVQKIPASQVPAWGANTGPWLTNPKP